MTTKILSTLLAALLAPIPMLVHAAVLIVTAPIAPFWVISAVVRKELQRRSERERCRRTVKAAVAMRSAALSQSDPTNN